MIAIGVEAKFASGTRVDRSRVPIQVRQGDDKIVAAPRRVSTSGRRGAAVSVGRRGRVGSRVIVARIFFIRQQSRYSPRPRLSGRILGFVASGGWDSCG